MPTDYEAAAIVDLFANAQPGQITLAEMRRRLAELESRRKEMPNLTRDEHTDLSLIAAHGGAIPVGDYETPGELSRLSHLVRLGMVEVDGGMVRLTEAGARIARVVRA